MTDDRRKAETQAVYDRQAQAWDDKQRLGAGEGRWIAKLLEGLSTGCRVLDLGCGTGKPMAARVLAAGHYLTGIDLSAEMIRIAKANYPDATWCVGDICEWSEPDSYDVIFSWDGVFHLSPDEQRRVLPGIANGLRSGGRLMMTIGDRESEITGQVYGEPVYHGSLSHSEYRSLLQSCGLSNVTIFDQRTFDADRILLWAEKAG